MSRSSRRRSGRPYQPLPPRSGNALVARLLVFVVAVTLILGALVLVFGR